MIQVVSNVKSLSEYENCLPSASECQFQPTIKCRLSQVVIWIWPLSSIYINKSLPNRLLLSISTFIASSQHFYGPTNITQVDYPEPLSRWPTRNLGKKPAMILIARQKT